MRKFWQKIKKMSAVTLIIILLPYIITIFMNGKDIETNQNGQSKKIRVREESGEIDIALDEYCIGVLAKQVSSDYELQMLKAQAVIVRTTIYDEISKEEKNKVLDYGFLKKKQIESQWYKQLKEVWEDTEGQVVLYNNELALVPFHQLSNGKTRKGSEVLGTEDYPYLQVKECPKDVEAEEQMKSKLLNIKKAEIVAKDSAGYVTSVKVGEETCNGESFRDTYELPSSCFELQEFEGKIRVTTKGVGHGLGLSQHTANEMAKQGKTYYEILEYFFEGTEIKEVAEILWETE